MCEILIDAGIVNIVPSSGYRIDNLADFIIASEFLKSHFDQLQITLSANFWNNQHFEMIYGQKFYALRSGSINILNDLVTFNSNYKK